MLEAKGICCVCDVDFSLLLNGYGVRALHVHHRTQLSSSDSPRVTRIEDLAVVCANCHMLIHLEARRTLSVEDLRQRLGR
jgi:5-methylcytosine-specific restriction protein A